MPTGLKNWVRILSLSLNCKISLTNNWCGELVASRIAIELTINTVASTITYILANDIVKALVVFLALVVWDIMLSRKDRVL